MNKSLKHKEWLLLLSGPEVMMILDGVVKNWIVMSHHYEGTEKSWIPKLEKWEMNNICCFFFQHGVKNVSHLVFDLITVEVGDWYTASLP